MKRIHSLKIRLKKIFVFKPFKLNSWSGSWGYNPNYPAFIKISPSATLQGEVKLRFKLPKTINPMEIIYEFNFIFADSDISEYINSISSDELNDKFLYNKTVRFKLRK